MVETVVVTGSRLWKDNKAVWAVLAAHNPLVIVQGGAIGVDSAAIEWAKAKGRVAVTYYPDWDSGKGAALRRNIEMLEDNLQATVLAFPLPESRGTWHTVREAQKRKMDCVVTRPEDS